MGDRIHWWWEGIVDWFRDLPYAWREWRRDSAERLQRTWWRVTEWVLDVLHVLRSRLVLRRPVHQLAVARSTRLATLEQWLTHRQGELRAREADLDDWTAEQATQVVTPAEAIRARRRFDPELASELRRARHERRRG